jgi:hypothetical protein
MLNVKIDRDSLSVEAEDYALEGAAMFMGRDFARMNPGNKICYVPGIE